MNEVDYLIRGTSIHELVFANTVVEKCGARVALVDPRGVPGGHWHQVADCSRLPPPYSAFGLPAFSIQDWRPELTHIERDTVLAYCAHVLNHRLLPSGRVHYFPRCDYRGDGKIVSVDTGEAQNISVTRRFVTSGHTAKLETGPHLPCFSCTNAIDLLHPRDVSSHPAFQARQYDAYCILGAGRTAIEAALYLLRQNISPDQIRWVKSREKWTLSTPEEATSLAQFDDQVAMSLNSLRLMSQAHSVQALCRGLEGLGLLLRTSPDEEPHGFSSQLLTREEAAKLCTIRDIIRKGHVHAISEIGMVLDGGAVPMPQQTLYIDGTGSIGTASKPPPIFQGPMIHLADVRLCQPSFSAAVIGAIELLEVSDSDKNALCAPLHSSDLTTQFMISILNHHAWFHNGAVREWLESCRLDGLLQIAARQLNSTTKMPSALRAIRAVLPRAIINLERMFEQAGAEDPLLN